MNELEEVREILGEVCDHLLINIDNGNYDNLPSVVNIARSRAILAGLLARSKKEAKSSHSDTDNILPSVHYNVYETAVYDGQTKSWRILNICTGTVYASHFKTKEDAEANIMLDSEKGVSPSSHVVYLVPISEVLKCVISGFKT